VAPELDERTETFLAERGTPYVFSHYPPLPGRPDVDWVYVDHERGGMLVGEHFDACGYQSIVVLGDPETGLEFEQRLSGVRKALTLAGSTAQIRILPGIPSLASGYALVAENPDIIADADAIFAMNDLMAIGAIQALQANGISIPGDIAVVGYDDTPLAETLHPSLTTVRQPSEEVAFMTCERLIDMIESAAGGGEHQPRHISLQPQLIVRQSSAGCARPG
jgi:LacI family transcriptional regulator